MANSTSILSLLKNLFNWQSCFFLVYWEDCKAITIQAVYLISIIKCCYFHNFLSKSSCTSYLSKRISIHPCTHTDLQTCRTYFFLGVSNKTVHDILQINWYDGNQYIPPSGHFQQTVIAHTATYLHDIHLHFLFLKKTKTRQLVQSRLSSVID